VLVETLLENQYHTNALVGITDLLRNKKAGIQPAFSYTLLFYYHFNSSTTTEAGGIFTCSAPAFKPAPLKATGFILSGLVKEL
jgi:hypothetical protein